MGEYKTIILNFTLLNFDYISNGRFFVYYNWYCLAGILLL